MTSKLVPLEAWHIQNIRTKPEDGVSDIHRDIISKTADMTFSFSLIGENGEVYACGGIVTVAPGVGECWLVCAEGSEIFNKSICRNLINMIKAGGQIYHRLQTIVKVTDTRSLRFDKWLGFTEEGVMRKYDSLGNDYVRLAKV
jgi:hypothetical protein